MASESIDQRVGARVRQVLAARALSQQALGTLLAQSQGWVSRRLRGCPGFSIAELARLSAALDVPLDFFTGDLLAVPDLRPVA